MATWDGSDQAGPSDDPNFYLFAHASNAASDPRSWDYYPMAGYDGYPHGSMGLYAHNNLPNVATTQSYQSATYQDPVFPPVHDNTSAMVNDRPCFFENNRQLQKLPSFNSRYSGHKQDNGSTKQSNLHAGASEFVPTGGINSLQKSPSIPVYNETNSLHNDFALDNPESNSRIFFSDNRNRTNDRRYDNTKNGNSNRGAYRGQRIRNYNVQRTNDSSAIAQDTMLGNTQQSEDNLYRAGPKGQRATNQGRFRVDRYPNNRRPQHNEKPRSDRGKMPVDTWQNPVDVSRENTTSSNDEPRENSMQTAYNNRGKWPRSENKAYERYLATRLKVEKSHAGSNGYDEQQSLFEPQAPGNLLPVTRKENSHGREGDRNLYRNDRGRAKPRDNLTNYNGSGHSYYDSEGHGDSYDRSRDDSKRSRDPRDEEPQNWRQKDKIPTKGGVQKKNTKKIEFGKL